MNQNSTSEDAVKMHKDASSLMAEGKYGEARDLFLKTAARYQKAQNFLYATTMYYKAGECSFVLKEYAKAVEYFKKSADLSFEKGEDGTGLCALEYIRDSEKALGNLKQVEELEKRIKEMKAKHVNDIKLSKGHEKKEIAKANLLLLGGVLFGVWWVILAFIGVWPPGLIGDIGRCAVGFVGVAVALWAGQKILDGLREIRSIA